MKDGETPQIYNQERFNETFLWRPEPDDAKEQQADEVLSDFDERVTKIVREVIGQSEASAMDWRTEVLDEVITEKVQEAVAEAIRENPQIKARSECQNSPRLVCDNCKIESFNRHQACTMCGHRHFTVRD